MSEALYLLSLDDLLNRALAYIPHGMIGVVVADERHTGDDRSCLVKIRKHPSAAIIVAKMRKAMYAAQFAEQAEAHYSSELGLLVEELISRSFSLCIGFVLGDTDDIQCKFYGDAGQWEMIVEWMEENIEAKPEVFGELK